ncbi:MAG: alpha/beta hydrolase [Burkholderiaceae bacterium]
MTSDSISYVPRRAGECRSLVVRGLRLHLRHWPGDGRRRVVMLHGWADVGASFQFVVDALPAHWDVYAPDWRGFGASEPGGTDCYWFYDYLADLDQLLEQLFGDAPVDLVGHSMGGNVACLYAGARPTRVARLVNLEGLGLPATDPAQAPARLAEWLDELRAPPQASLSDDLPAVAARLMRNNPRLRPGRAAFLARHWSAPTDDGRFRVLLDPAHKISNPYLYRADEVRACWAAITAPTLWVMCEHQGKKQGFVQSEEYAHRLSVIRDLHRAVVADAGHMVHHDQPEAVADLIESFLR